MSMDELLDKKITIRDGVQMGIISARVLSDCDIFMRVQTIMEKENLPKTHAVEKLAEICKINESTVWRSYSFTSRIMQVI
jgi:hypothetical protein